MDKRKKVLYWLPRLLAAIFIGFITIFSFDVFGTGEPWWRQIAGFFIHSIPSILYAGALVWAWKNGKWGGLAFIILAALTVLRFGFDNVFVVCVMFPILLTIGVLFYFQPAPSVPPVQPGPVTKRP